MHESQYLGTLWILIWCRKLHWEVTKLKKWKRKITGSKFTTNSFFFKVTVRLHFCRISHTHLYILFPSKGTIRDSFLSDGPGWPHVGVVGQNLPNIYWDSMASGSMIAKGYGLGTGDAGSRMGKCPVNTEWNSGMVWQAFGFLPTQQAEWAQFLGGFQIQVRFLCMKSREWSYFLEKDDGRSRQCCISWFCNVSAHTSPGDLVKIRIQI